MRNKAIIISFLILTALTGAAQTGDFDKPLETEVSVYPNPAVEYIIVEIGNSPGKVKFELNSMIGNKIIVQPEDLGSGKFRISLKNFATGYYFLIVKDEEKKSKYAHKILVSSRL